MRRREKRIATGIFFIVANPGTGFGTLEHAFLRRHPATSAQKTGTCVSAASGSGVARRTASDSACFSSSTPSPVTAEIA